jgi:hypothetical protein
MQTGIAEDKLREVLAALKKVGRVDIAGQDSVVTLQ